jgi:hypothetical protein
VTPVLAVLGESKLAADIPGHRREVLASPRRQSFDVHSSGRWLHVSNRSVNGAGKSYKRFRFLVTQDEPVSVALQRFLDSCAAGTAENSSTVVGC